MVSLSSLIVVLILAGSTEAAVSFDLEQVVLNLERLVLADGNGKSVSEDVTTSAPTVEWTAVTSSSPTGPPSTNENPEMLYFATSTEQPSTDRVVLNRDEKFEKKTFVYLSWRERLAYVRRRKMERKKLLKAKLSSCKRMLGLFVQPCQIENVDPTDALVISHQDTRMYSSDFSYTIDRTYYRGDFSSRCNPRDSEVLFKSQFHGRVSYHGSSAKVDRACSASIQFTKGSFFVADTVEGTRVIDDLNTNCPCGGTWAVEKWRTVKSSQCKPQPETASSLCKLVTGQKNFFNYQWQSETQYVTSKDEFTKEVGWANDVREDYVREFVPESGNTDPESCSNELWYDSRDALRAAESKCAFCVGIECTGCLYRELTTRWHKWCPCLHRYANVNEITWMNAQC